MEIYLAHFRNIEEKKIKFNKYPVFIVGKNGSGKTGILEAIYFLSTSKSFRSHQKNSLVNFKQNQASLELKIHPVKSSFREESQSDYLTGVNRKFLRISLNKTGDNQYFVNNEITPRYKFINQILTEVFWWGDFKMVYGGPEERRRFLNLFCLQIEPVYLQYLSLYKKIIKERKFALLKNNLNLLEIWDKKLAVMAEKIYIVREKALKLINLKLDKILDSIRPKFDHPSVKYKGKFLSRHDFLIKLKHSRPKDLLDFKTHFGPHRDDLKFTWRKIDLKNFSQGEVKSYVLGMKLNFLLNLPQKEKYFLIDDVFAEIDEVVIMNLLKLATKKKIKLILTQQDLPKVNLAGQLVKL
jgi:DNA replication and repair protein RecF